MIRNIKKKKGKIGIKTQTPVAFLPQKVFFFFFFSNKFFYTAASESGASIMAAEPDVTARVGSSVTLNCYVHPDGSGHTPHVEWTKEGGYPLPQNAFPRGEMLQIVDVSPSDEGRYSCQISTPSGIQSDYVYLRVDSE